MRRHVYVPLILCLILSLVFAASAGASPGGANRGPWAPNVSYNVGDTVTFNGSTYQCIQAHTSLTGWEPPNVPALWGLVSGGSTNTPTRTPTRTNTPGGPTATLTRTPTRTNTASAPSNTPTRTATASGNNRGPWAPNVAYNVGDNVTYGGSTYRCLQAHTSLTGWEPPNVPALWTLVTGGGPTATPTRTNTPGGPTATPTRTSSPPPPGTKVFAPYIDVSPGASSAIMQLANNGSGSKHYTLAFILGAGCSASWFGAFPMNSAEADAIGTRINELRAVGGDVIIAFGGAAAPELANVCPSASALQAQYQAVVTKYNLRTIDLDIEDFNPTAIDIRNKALKGLEAANPGLRVQYTLGVLESGFTQAQMDVLNNARANGTRVDLVNIMAMDYGHPVPDMFAAATSAAQAARTWLNNNGFAGTQLGITPMIGANDTPGETFTLSNASSLVTWANNNGVTELAFWSVGRDNGGCPNGSVSPSCSGIAQSNFQFSSIFHGFAP